MQAYFTCWRNLIEMSNQSEQNYPDPGLVHQLKGLKDVVLDVDFVSKTNQEKVAAACNDNSILVWALDNPNNIRAFK